MTENFPHVNIPPRASPSRPSTHLKGEKIRKATAEADIAQARLSLIEAETIKISAETKKIEAEALKSQAELKKITALIALRQDTAQKIFHLMLVLSAAMTILIFLQGVIEWAPFKFKLDQGILWMFVTSTLVEIFLLARIITKSIFPGNLQQTQEGPPRSNSDTEDLKMRAPGDSQN